MNAKKITALVLAAMMAVGTSVTAFADSDVVNRGRDLDAKRPLTFNDDRIYEDVDGVLTPSNDFRPGDTLYIRLDELNSNGDKDIEDEKDDMKVYADWKVGKDTVEKVSIVYDKGTYEDNGINSYTVEVGGKTFYIDAKEKKALVALVEDEIVEEMKSNPYFLEDEIASKKASYFVADGLDASGKIYKSVETFAEGEGFTEPTKLYVDDATAITGQGLTYEWTTWNIQVDASDYWYKHNTGNWYDYMKKSATMADIDAAGYAKHVTNVYVDENGSDISANIDDIVLKEVITEEAIAAADAADIEYGNRYTYWVKIETKKDDTTKVLDLAGILRIGSSKNKAEDVKNAFQLDTSMDNRVYDSTGYVTVEDEWTFYPNSRSVVRFDDDVDDVVLYFGENEDAWFEVDARGQSDLNMEFDFDFNREIADLFPRANIDFINFTSTPSFNRTGTLYIVADADSYIYEVTEDGVKEIANAKYNEDEEAWEIRTRKLTAYAISDRELDTSITLDGEDNTSSSNTSNNGGKDNPDTGR